MDRRVVGVAVLFFALAVRFYIGGVFIYACVHKIAHPELFAMDVATYDILPLFLVNLMAVCLPWVELAAGVLVITGFQARAGALLLTGMMIMFVIALSIALYNGLDMACGCFASSEAEESISIQTLFRDLAWLACSLYVLIWDRRPIGIETLLKRRKDSLHAQV